MTLFLSLPKKYVYFFLQGVGGSGLDLKFQWFGSFVTFLLVLLSIFKYITTESFFEANKLANLDASLRIQHD